MIKNNIIKNTDHLQAEVRDGLVLLHLIVQRQKMHYQMN